MRLVAAGTGVHNVSSHHSPLASPQSSLVTPANVIVAGIRYRSYLPSDRCSSYNIHFQEGFISKQKLCISEAETEIRISNLAIKIYSRMIQCELSLESKP
ncbi:unnamed protein product [Leptidea sinapis]|uniref:Uncharacterized protein n=1 Tax=Leptidea sinapis TaxID=189913 RepID=A0A5E4QEJ0_9NEOP|nr:unnamed protein product [Leptidea sinapis]